MTLQQRCDAFAAAFPKRKASWPYVRQEAGRDVLYATWVIGNDFRNRAVLYGAHPHGYLDRLLALFPDVVGLAHFDGEPPILHAFSGSLEPDPRWVRVDINPERSPDICGSVYDIGNLTTLSFKLVCADPIYSGQDAKRYGTRPVDRRRATAALAGVVWPGHHMGWLDTCWPMHNKKQWVTVGRITVIRATNHRVRLLSLFERV